jgi:hypothetical protein
MKRLLPLLTGLALVALAIPGCKGTKIYPVEGVVVDAKDQPIKELKGSVVEFDSLEEKISANGVIDEHGKFKLTTKTPGDGAWLGKHRVLIARGEVEVDVKTPRVILSKYEAFETSGLEATVEAKSNHITLKVERIKGKK